MKVPRWLTGNTVSVAHGTMFIIFTTCSLAIPFVVNKWELVQGRWIVAAYAVVTIATVGAWVRCGGHCPCTQLERYIKTEIERVEMFEGSYLIHHIHRLTGIRLPKNSDFVIVGILLALAICFSIARW